MGEKHFDLAPAQQFTSTDQGHFGELIKEVYQEKSGLVARTETWDRSQWSALEHELQGRSDGPRDPGPYNKTFLDMEFGGNIYSLGQDTKTLTINDEPVKKGSAQYNAAIAKMEKAAKSINFDAPSTHSGQTTSLWVDLDKQRQ